MYRLIIIIYLFIVFCLGISCSAPSKKQETDSIPSSQVEEIEFELTDLSLSSGNIQKTFDLPGRIIHASLVDMVTKSDEEELIVAYYMDSGKMNPTQLHIKIFKNPFLNLKELDNLDPILLFEYPLYLEIEPNGEGIRYVIEKIRADSTCEHGGIKIISYLDTQVQTEEIICATETELTYKNHQLKVLDIDSRYDHQKLISFDYLSYNEYYSQPFSEKQPHIFGNLYPKDGNYTPEEILIEESALLSVEQNSSRIDNSLHLGNVAFKNDEMNTYWYQGKTSTGLGVVLRKPRAEPNQQIILVDTKMDVSTALAHTAYLAELTNGDLIQLKDESAPGRVRGALKRLKLTRDTKIVEPDFEIKFWNKSPYGLRMLNDTTLVIELYVKNQGIEGPTQFLKFTLENSVQPSANFNEYVQWIKTNKEKFTAVPDEFHHFVTYKNYTPVDVGTTIDQDTTIVLLRSLLDQGEPIYNYQVNVFAKEKMIVSSDLLSGEDLHCPLPNLTVEAAKVKVYKESCSGDYGEPGTEFSYPDSTYFIEPLQLVKR